MATNPQRVRVLAKQILSLDPDDRLELLQLVVTPELELRLLVESLQGKIGTADPRVIARDVNRTVREVRSRRKSASTLCTP
ncbi:MAG TPA: hypothetical protein VH988_16615 [Thermoanaerobaculia bacterium]|jgi:hypothetical protein|nr:hypothetical protein [Thermoanaerobaculia bacterium]